MTTLQAPDGVSMVDIQVGGFKQLIGSMGLEFLHIFALEFMVNIGKYSIHGAFG